MKHNQTLTAARAIMFITPIAGVLAARFIGTAAGTVAASGTPEPATPIAALPPIHERTDRADALGMLPSPFRPIDEPEVREATEQGEAPRGAAPAPVFTLTAVMPHPLRPIAVVDGRPRTTGETLAPGWTLAEIDGSNRAIVIDGPQGERVRVRMGNQNGGR